MTDALRIIAIDPGISGGWALLDVTPSHVNTPTLGDMPSVDGQVDAASLAELVARLAPTLAVIEEVGARPHQGLSSTFSFGRAMGVALGVLGAARVPLHRVTPLTWKRHFRLKGPNKEPSRRLALQLYPLVASQLARKQDHGRAEALLLARFMLDRSTGSIHV